jgi:hypothetical protein
MPNKSKKIKREIAKEHLGYGLDMLQRTYEALLGQITGSGQLKRITTNALIESFCIHARSLIEFFSNKQGAHARDFTMTGKYKASSISKIRSQTIQKLNTHVAHLTYDRTTETSKKIGVAERRELLVAIVEEAVSFKEQMKPGYRSLFSWSPPQLDRVPVSRGQTATNSITMTTLNLGMGRRGK